jgi:hypothetical protein
MKRSEHVGLAVMGVAAFAATFASASTYLARPSTSLRQPAQNCAPRADGTQNCERRGFTYYLLHGWWGGSSAQPMKTQGAALIASARSPSPASGSSIVRGGFGATAASAPFRVSAGG